ESAKSNRRLVRPVGSPSGRRRRSRTSRTSRPPRGCAPAPSSRRAARLRPAPFRGGGAHRWALFGRIHGGGDGRRTAREYAGAVGMVLATPSAFRPSARGRWRRRTTGGLARGGGGGAVPSLAHVMTARAAQAPFRGGTF